MITNVLTAIQFMLVIFSLGIIFYNIHRGDNKRSTYLGLLLDTCLLWLLVI